jgi:hypothetical protein
MAEWEPESQGGTTEGLDDDEELEGGEGDLGDDLDDDEGGTNGA